MTTIIEKDDSPESRDRILGSVSGDTADGTPGEVGAGKPAAASPAKKSDGKPTNILLLFIGLMVVMLLASLSQNVLSTALPTIVGELNGVDMMTWVITGYILASTVMMPVYGRISDALGRKPVLIAAITLFIGGSIIGGVAGNIEWLIVGRVIQGLGGGGLMILSQAAIADAVPARERGKYMGVMGAVFAVASVAGPLLGGFLTEGPGWRWAFWINLPLGIAAVVAIMILLPSHPRGPKPKLDYLGMTLAAAATVSIVLVCTWGGGTYAWDSWQILCLIGAAIVLAGLFVLVEWKAAEPVIPLFLFRNRNFVLATIATLAIGVAMFGVIGYMPTYIQMVTGVDARVAGLLMIPMMGGLLVASTVSGALVTKTGSYRVFPIVGTFILAGGMFILSRLGIDTPTWVLCCGLAIVGIGLGLSMQILTLIVQNEFPVKMVGTATAAISFFKQIGATVGSAVVGSIFATRLASHLQENVAAAGKGAAAALASHGSGSKSLTPALVNSLPEPLHSAILSAYNEALLPIFSALVPAALIAAVILFFIRKTHLSETNEEPVREVVELDMAGEAAAGGAARAGAGLVGAAGAGAGGGLVGAGSAGAGAGAGAGVPAVAGSPSDSAAAVARGADAPTVYMPASAVTDQVRAAKEYRTVIPAAQTAAGGNVPVARMGGVTAPGYVVVADQPVDVPRRLE